MTGPSRSDPAGAADSRGCGPGDLPDRTPALIVVTVSARARFREAVRRTLTDVTMGSKRRLLQDPPAAPATDWVPVGPWEYRVALIRPRQYLDRQLPHAAIRLVEAACLADVPAEVAAAVGTGDGHRLALLLIDADGSGIVPDAFHQGITTELEATLRALPAAVRPEISPYTVYLYEKPSQAQVQPTAPFTLRHLPDDPWLLAADVACALADHVEVRHARPLTSARLDRTSGSTLGAALYSFLTARAGTTWGLHCYTGSVVSELIADLERRARLAGNPVLASPSEHGLACSAMARWMLDGAPFLIVVTSGMVDEFKGTLANLKQAGARGLIVCADAPPDRWFPFQGTVHAAEDSRAVLRARGLPVVYLPRVADIGDGLAEAFAAYDAGDGPVVVLAAPSVLESMTAPPTVPAPPAAPARVTVGPPAQLDAVLSILDSERTTLLWQCGQLDDEESRLLHEAARRTGAALADSLTRPGTVARYRDGREVEEYLGTLGLYGFSARVYDYLHRDGRLRPPDEQCLFFLKSRIGEVSTPFSARTLQRALRVVQVTDVAGHVAPFTDHPVVGDLRGFLRAVLSRLDVDPEVLAWRRAAIRAVREIPDPLATLPLKPMTANYFLHQLNTVVEGLIRDEGYRYTGVYDVGRGGAAAVRNVVRTGPGFSGWYGRALMGDALQAVPAIALTRPDNVLAFVGDGAAALVPDILPSLVQRVCLEGHRLRGNLSIFRLLNSSHSLIRTYREARYSPSYGPQTTVVNLVEEDWQRIYGDPAGARLPVTHRRLDGVDPAALRTALTTPGTVDLYSVILAHNNEGDGLSLLSGRSWHHTDGVVPPRPPAAAAGPPAPRGAAAPVSGTMTGAGVRR